MPLAGCVANMARYTLDYEDQGLNQTALVDNWFSVKELFDLGCVCQKLATWL